MCGRRLISDRAPEAEVKEWCKAAAGTCQGLAPFHDGASFAYLTSITLPQSGKSVLSQSILGNCRP